MADQKTVFSDTNTTLENSNQEQVLGDKLWYAVSCFSGKETKVAQNLQKRVETMGIESLVSRIIVAEAETPVMKDGLPTGQMKMKTFLPTYIFVEMIMTDYAWYVIRNTPGVTGFIGSSGKGTKPFPIPREQMEPVLKRIGLIDEGMLSRYNVGDHVKIIRGPFEGAEGTILEIKTEESGVINVVVEVNIFFNKNIMEVEFSEIEKID